uniref:Helitron helicase-like domain-containing protein n=1 Tax=Meloidogyne enterolobii TaxID=390850 RepID=A0A6V7YCN6_MELEN|nr:unnamed protein product [Meloidogyne enterolobii]
MVRKKQKLIQQDLPCSSSSIISIATTNVLASNLENIENDNRINPVQSSGFEKRNENSLKRKINYKNLYINLDKDDDSFYSKTEKKASKHELAKFYNLGNFNILCNECNAIHFQEEQIKTNHSKSFCFNNCCKEGKLKALNDKIEEYPEELKSLFNESHPYNKNFINNIRQYNNAFACASISCFKFNFPTPGPPCYKIQGQLYHKFNISAKPFNSNELPTNGQLYFLDSSTSIDLITKQNTNLDSNIISYIEKIIREKNKFAQSYKLMKDVYTEYEKNYLENGVEIPEIRLLFSLKENYDKRRFNIPISNEVCAILVSDANNDFPPANIVVYPKTEKKLKNLYPLDKCVEPMCYPLLYPTSTFGHNFELKNSFSKKITLCDYWIVDQASKVEWERLEYIKKHQKELCSSNYSNVEDFLKQKAGKSEAEIKKKIILPSTFIGGPRSMHENFMDAMAIVNETGKPDLFITFTCNPNDPDILKCLFKDQTASDRPDIVTRVFNLKKKYLLELILNENIFGKVIGYCWVIEYQKRGLPHIHLLITLEQKDKWHNTNDIDNFISAEIPDRNKDSELYNLFREVTEITEDGYPLYKRSNNNRFVYKKGQKLTNQYVVPYNPFLLKTFRAHINVERVSDVLVVKYLYDYIYKGYDAATIECVQINNDNTQKILNYDEVSKYLEARYLSPCEACWRIFKFPLQGKSHSVDKFDIHLEKMQNVYFNQNANEIEIQEASEKDSTLTAYF